MPLPNNDAPVKDERLELPVEFTINKDAGEIQGYACKWNVVDKAGDSFRVGSFKKTISEKGGKIPLYNKHLYDAQGNHRVEARRVGDVEVKGEDAVGLPYTAKFHVDAESQKSRAEVLNGDIRAVSVSVRPIKWHRDNRQSGRVFEEVEWIELTLAKNPVIDYGAEILKVAAVDTQDEPSPLPATPVAEPAKVEVETKEKEKAVEEKVVVKAEAIAERAVSLAELSDKVPAIPVNKAQEIEDHWTFVDNYLRAPVGSAPSVPEQYRGKRTPGVRLPNFTSLVEKDMSCGTNPELCDVAQRLPNLFQLAPESASLAGLATKVPIPSLGPVPYTVLDQSDTDEYAGVAFVRTNEGGEKTSKDICTLEGDINCYERACRIVVTERLLRLSKWPLASKISELVQGAYLDSVERTILGALGTANVREVARQTNGEVEWVDLVNLKYSLMPQHRSRAVYLVADRRLRDLEAIVNVTTGLPVYTPSVAEGAYPRLDGQGVLSTTRLGAAAPADPGNTGDIYLLDPSWIQLAQEKELTIMRNDYLYMENNKIGWFAFAWWGVAIPENSEPLARPIAKLVPVGGSAP